MTSDVGGKFLVVVAFFIERDGQVLLLRRSESKDHAPGERNIGKLQARVEEVTGLAQSRAGYGDQAVKNAEQNITARVLDVFGIDSLGEGDKSPELNG